MGYHENNNENKEETSVNDQEFFRQILNAFKNECYMMKETVRLEPLSIERMCI